MNNASSCSQKCTNTIGSYECTCEDGYYMGSDGHTCLDVDECTQRNDTNCQQKCVNDDGSFHCECDQPGYKLSVTNGSACIKDDNTSTNDIISVAISTTVITVIIIAAVIAIIAIVVIAVVIVIVKQMKKKSKPKFIVPPNDVPLKDFDVPPNDDIPVLTNDVPPNDVRTS
jgi:hypothetical protein